LFGGSENTFKETQKQIIRSITCSAKIILLTIQDAQTIPFMEILINIRTNHNKCLNCWPLISEHFWIQQIHGT
jgi:hypothetical protein